MIDTDKARMLWGELHSFGKQEHTLSQQMLFFAEWLASVEAMLGCATCFKKVKLFLSKWPVDYGEGFHLWGICLHDYVNKDLGRNLFYPQFTIAPLTSRGILQ